MTEGEQFSAEEMRKETEKAREQKDQSTGLYVDFSDIAVKIRMNRRICGLRLT